MMWFTFMNSFSAVIALGEFFDTYLYLRGGRRSMQVGWAESCNGIAALLMSLPTALVVDKTSRARLLRLSAVAGLGTSALTALGILGDSFALILAGLFLSGCVSTVVASASSALFADSIPLRHRTRMYTNLHILETLAGALGYSLVAVFFAVLGDCWKLWMLHVALVFGNVGLMTSMCFLQNWRDVRGAREDCPGEDELIEERVTCSVVPYLIVANDLVMSVGAGMTVKYFPLFFIQDYSLRPYEICILFGISPLSTAATMKGCEWASRTRGRPFVTLLSSTCGVICLVTISQVRDRWVVIVAFILRDALTNGVTPLDTSMLMDAVPRKHRGKWSTMDSVVLVSWSASAILGGLLIDAEHHDFRLAFLLTSAIYAVALVIRAPLLYLVDV